VLWHSLCWGESALRVTGTSALQLDNMREKKTEVMMFRICTEELDAEPEPFPRSLTEVSTWSEQPVRVPVYAQFFRMETPTDTVSNEELSTAEHKEPARHDTEPSTTQPMNGVMIAQSVYSNPHKTEPSTTGGVAHEISHDVSAWDKMTTDETSGNYTKQDSIKLLRSLGVVQTRLAMHNWSNGSNGLSASLPGFPEKSPDAGTTPPTGCESEQDKKLHAPSANLKSDSWTMAGKHNVLVCLDGCALGLKALIR